MVEIVGDGASTGSPPRRVLFSALGRSALLTGERVILEFASRVSGSARLSLPGRPSGPFEHDTAFILVDLACPSLA